MLFNNINDTRHFRYNGFVTFNIFNLVVLAKQTYDHNFEMLDYEYTFFSYHIF